MLSPVHRCRDLRLECASSTGESDPAEELCQWASHKTHAMHKLNKFKKWNARLSRSRKPSCFSTVAVLPIWPPFVAWLPADCQGVGVGATVEAWIDRYEDRTLCCASKASPSSWLMRVALANCRPSGA